MKENINNIEDVFEWIDYICDISQYLTDQELADYFKEVTDYCSGDNKNNTYYTITHFRKINLIRFRVEKYCKKNKIKIENYVGPLPYRVFILDDKNETRKKKLKKLKIMIKKQKIKKFFRKINVFKW